MKEFLQTVWALFMLVAIVGGAVLQHEVKRQKERQTLTPLPKRENPLELPKLRSMPDYEHLRPLPKFTTWEPHPEFISDFPRTEIAPMPRAKLEVAPMPREVESDDRD